MREGHTISVSVGPIDPGATLGVLQMLPNDPTVHSRGRHVERATRTPDGPASVRVAWTAEQDTVEVTAWGDGASWILDRVDGLLGLEDDVTGFEPPDGVLRDAWRRTVRRRMLASRTLWHDVACLIVQQRITTPDAAQQWRRLVLTHGEPAPGPVVLMVPPDPQTIVGLDYHEFHPLGIERQRAQFLRAAARRMAEFDQLVDRPFADVQPRLESIPGIGPWTSSFLASTTWGDADAVIVGDAGIPSMMTWLLAREPKGTDERMLELLEPYRPHRGRLIHLGFSSGVHPPRRHPRGHRTDIRRI